MKKLALGVLLLLAVPLAADCPRTSPCPIDGEDGYNTYQCKEGRSGKVCQFKHSRFGQPSHYYWVKCD